MCDVIRRRMCDAASVTECVSRPPIGMMETLRIPKLGMLMASSLLSLRLGALGCLIFPADVHRGDGDEPEPVDVEPDGIHVVQQPGAAQVSIRRRASSATSTGRPGSVPRCVSRSGSILSYQQASGILVVINGAYRHVEVGALRDEEVVDEDSSSITAYGHAAKRRGWKEEDVRRAPPWTRQPRGSARRCTGPRTCTPAECPYGWGSRSAGCAETCAAGRRTPGYSARRNTSPRTSRR